MPVPETVDAYLASLPVLRGRRLAHGEWGITIPAENAGGEPLDVGLRLSDGLLRAQAVAVHGGGHLDPWLLLWWNRQTRLVRFGCTRSRDIWIHADLPVPGLDERALDRLLGLVTEAALTVRRL
ncbi:MAG TPA: YbjN domain-containing protein [Thermoleophilaceae bacterium]|nr:YbjN domain-containing protein [Thermoleophilaceae bacterium]